MTIEATYDKHRDVIVLRRRYKPMMLKERPPSTEDVERILALSKLSMPELRKRYKALERAFYKRTHTKAMLIYGIVFLRDPS